MKNEFWAVGCGLGCTVEKKGFGSIMSNFGGLFFKVFMDKKLIYFFENVLGSARKVALNKGKQK